ncbi:hypothetical protein QL285_000978 [Trifolium repens]|nr:hypothetical protein QL285_000978 [Trifolium repens]
MGSKFDIEKFTGSNDFGLWKVKMKAVLVHNKCVEALKGKTRLEWFCKLQGGVHRGSTEFETSVEEFHLKVEDFQLEVEASNSDTKGGETTLTLGYQEGDREESGSGSPKWEAIGNTDSRTWELVGLLEVVGHKESSLLELEQQPKIPRLVEDKQVFESTGGIPGFEEGVVKLVGLSKRPMIVGCKRIFRRTGLITPGSEEVAVSLVGATKNPMVVGDKTFMRAEGIPRDEEVEVQLVILARVVGSKWKRSRNSENQKTEETSSTVAPGARRSPEMAVASGFWRGAQGTWR